MRHLLLWFAISSLGGWLLGALKRRPQPGFWLGLLFGPVGWILLLLLPRVRPACPGCGRPLEDEAKSCPHCGRVLIDVPFRVHE